MADQKMKIFISAYACEPGKGSEIGVGWHWALEMSKYFELWVMTRSNNQEPIEQYFAEHPEDDYGIHWVYYDCPNYIKRFKHQMKGVRLYYTFWQYGSNKLVKKVMKENEIEIFHLLTYGNAIWRLSDYGQKKFFVWGPTGGVDTIPQEFSKYYTFKHRVLESVRRLVVRSLKINPEFYKKCRNADLIFCKARSTLNTIPKKYRDKAMLFTDVAMETASVNFTPIIRKQGSPLTYITVGRLDGWRGFDLLIEAFAGAVKIAPELHMKIIGEGSEMKRLRQKIADLHMEQHIELIGQITMEEYQREMQQCDAVLNACLKEGGVTNAFDCMTWGKPLLCIDTGGYTRNFDDECAIILPRKKRKELIESLTNGILRLTDENLRKQMSEAMVCKGKDITWSIKGMQIRDEIMKAWNKRNEG